MSVGLDVCYKNKKNEILDTAASGMRTPPPNAVVRKNRTAARKTDKVTFRQCEHFTRQEKWLAVRFLLFGQKHHTNTNLCATMRAEGGGVDNLLCSFLDVIVLLFFLLAV